MKHATGLETCNKNVFIVYLQLCVNKNLQNLAISTLQPDDVTVKTIYIIQNSHRGSKLTRRQ